MDSKTKLPVSSRKDSSWLSGNKTESRKSLSLNDKALDKIGHGYHSAYIRNLTARHINEFLHKRPSTDILVKNHLVQNTMTWSAEILSGTPPSARNCHTASVVGNKMFILGGYGGNKTSKNSIECFQLDFKTMSWEKTFVAGSVPKDRYSHTCTAVGTNLILFGGYSLEGCWLNDLRIIDTAQKQKFIPSLNLKSEEKSCVEEVSMMIWYQPKVKNLPCPRAAATAVACGNKIYYFGGNDGQKFFNDLHVLDTEKMECKELETKGEPPSPRAGHTATLVENNKMVVFGGGVAEGYSDELFILDLEKLEWDSPKIDGTAPSPRAGHTAIPILNKTAVLVFGGGFEEKVFGDLFMFDLESSKWTRPSDAGHLPQSRAGQSCVSVSNIAYFFGGADGNGHVFNDVHSLDTAFLVLKNLSRQSVERINYIKSIDLNELNLIKDYKNDLETLDEKIENAIKEQKKNSEFIFFILDELKKRCKENNLSAINSLSYLRKELKCLREKLNDGKKDSSAEIEVKEKEKLQNPTEMETVAKDHSKGRSKVKNGSKGKKEKSVVKDVCFLFESFKLSGEDLKRRSKRKKPKNGKKKR